MTELTDEQKEFLEAEGRIVLCACPGSGKTFIVGKKLLKYLETWSYPYRGVAVLSFTNVASEEVVHQMSQLSKDALLSVSFSHFIGTLDSFINNFIFLRFGYLMQSENRKRPHIVFDNYGEFTLISKNSQCNKKGCIQNPNMFHWSDSGLLRDNQPIDCGVQKKPCVTFKKTMLQKGWATQREVSALSLRLLKKYPSIAAELAYRFPVIIIDEAQDTSREQMEIIDILSSAGTMTTILVGDPDQAIYEWRDATPEYFKAKINAPQWNTMYLTANFRSSQRICNATAKFSSLLSGKQATTAKGDHATYPLKPILLQVNSNRSREDIVNKFKRLCQDNNITLNCDSVAILTRGKIHSDTNIKNLWQTPETYSLAAATYQWHCASRKEAFHLCEKALFNMTIDDVSGKSSNEIKQAVEKRIDYALWKKSVILLLSLLPSSTFSLREWQQNLTEQIEDMQKQSIISIRNQRNASDIIKLKTRTKIGSGYSSEFLNTPLKAFFEKKSTNDITISSVHGVKGESFDATLLIVDSTRGKTLTPTNLNSAPLDNELLRIAYVAMTRPRKLLMVSIPKQKSSGQLSRFPPDLWEYQEL